MLTASVVLTVLMVASISCHGPPGVPPRQGGGPPPGTHGGQQQFQQQQPPQQQQYQQQPPQQQQYQQQPPQQQQYQQQFQQQHPEVVEGHAHERGKNFKFQSEIHNADHILEHLQNVIKTKPKDQMSEEELEFHYFKMHDYDNNNKLDGVEIGKALTHFHDDDEEGVMDEKELEEMVDTVLGEDDINRDGYVEVGEFLKAQKRRDHDSEPYHPDNF